MSVSVADLQPKPFIVKIKGQDIECQPLELRHALMIAKMGGIFENPAGATTQELTQAQKDIEAVFYELMPSIDGLKFDMDMTMQLMTQVMEQIEPEDNKELKANKIDLGKTDPKAQRIG